MRLIDPLNGGHVSFWLCVALVIYTLTSRLLTLFYAKDSLNHQPLFA